MNFRTELSVDPSPQKIDLQHKILTLGSCFAQSIGQNFLQNKFETIANPFGSTYHPLAIHKQLKYAAFQQAPPEHTYLSSNEITLNYDFHSMWWGKDQADLHNKLQQLIGSVHHFLKDCKVLILTYGTSWVFEQIDIGEAVANCHKVPALQFTKRLSTAEEIVASFKETYNTLRSISPSLRIILTVSPVRHLKDTLPLNAVSKSILRTACHQIVQENSDIEYFPAYEIMMDDLRDYRFYKEDLIHPSDAAENYIWEKFSKTYFNPSTIDFLEGWKGIITAMNHKPFHGESAEHQKFIQQILIKLNELKSRTDVEQEVSHFKKQLL